jgi:hypothetical protein
MRYHKTDLVKRDFFGKRSRSAPSFAYAASIWIRLASPTHAG